MYYKILKNDILVGIGVGPSLPQDKYFEYIKITKTAYNKINNAEFGNS